jgi:periplasmic protein TonB
VIIGKEGRVANITVNGGHPLLISAALEAVRQWVYQPMLLNGIPVEVATQVDVYFSLP